MNTKFTFAIIIALYILLAVSHGTIDIREAGPLFNTYLGVCITLVALRLIKPYLEKEDKRRKEEK